MERRMRFLTVLTLCLGLLTACGTDKGSGGDQSTRANYELGEDSGGRAYIGVDACLNCHSTNPADEPFLKGKHVMHSDHISAQSDPECLECHDPVGDGVRLEKLMDPADVPGGGLTAVTCEACHGGGEEHFGYNPLSEPRPDNETCAHCHGELPEGHLAYHPEARNIDRDYVASNHYTSVEGLSEQVNGQSEMAGLCARCHSHEGARAYRNLSGGHDALTALMENKPPVAEPTPVQCRTCHDPHNTGALLMASTEERSAEFRTCVFCHQLEGSDGQRMSDAYHDPAVDPQGSPEQIITDTHFAQSGDWRGTARGANGVDIAGYSMNFADARVCRNCHNVHGAPEDGGEINRQWSRSRHARRDAAGAWAHYNWTESGVAGELRSDGSATSDRRACQKCHTTSGFRAFVQANARGEAFAAPLAYTPNYRPEMLHCDGCHEDNSGTVRDPGTVFAGYRNAQGVEVGFADAQGTSSAVCLPCHAGQRSGASIAALEEPLGGKDFGPFNSHYMAAAGILYGGIGFEFEGLDYTNAPWFAHDDVQAQGAGPCVGCHMDSSTDTHRFSPFVLDENDAPVATADVCNTCHSFRLATIETDENGFLQALEVLAGRLAANGIFYDEHRYPYFFSDVAGREVEDRYTEWSDKNTLGAAFNLNLLSREHGAYAHNRIYARRLLFDSIDFLDNGALTGTLAVDPDAYPDALNWLGSVRP